MLLVIVSGLAIGALYAATALVYNVMFSTSKVLSVTTGHLCMLGGVFGAWLVSAPRLSHRCLAWWARSLVGAAFGWLTEIVAIRRVLARPDEHLWLLTTLALATMVQQAVGLWWGTEPRPFPRLIPQDFSAGAHGPEVLAADRHRDRHGARAGVLLSAHDVRQAVRRHVGRRLRGAGAGHRRPSRVRSLSYSSPERSVR